MFQQNTKIHSNVRYKYSFVYLKVLDSMTHRKIEQEMMKVELVSLNWT